MIERLRTSRWFAGLGPMHAGIALSLIGGALCFASTPLWWLGGALLLSGITLVSRAGLRVARSSTAIEIVYVASIVAIGTVMMADILGGERPISHDHTIHYSKAWLMHTQLLPHGRLFGFSHASFAGYPANYLYPPGADLWVNAVHALGFGALSFSKAYAVAFALFHVFSGLAVYRFARLLGGCHVGLVAAVLWLTDLSNFRMGGWAYTVEYGVWPQTLSLAFALMALCSLPGIVQERRLWPLGAFGIWMGLAIITHPIQLIFLALLLVAVALAALFADAVRAATAVFRLLIAFGLSLLVASLWLIPFLSSRDETNQMGVWWDSAYEMGKGLLALRAFPGTLGYVIAFGALALFAALRSKRFLLLFTALLALLIPAVSNSTFLDELHLPAFAPAFTKVQFVRLSTMVKPFWFALAGYAFIAVLARARSLVLRDDDSVRRDESHTRAATFAAVVGLLTLPVLVPAAQALWTRHVRKAITTESERPFAEDRRKLEQWLVHNLPNDDFYRVGVFTGHDHELMDLGTLIDRPIYKRGFTPASNFIYQMNDADPAILEAVNLRYAISEGVLSADLFELLADFGSYRVYAFRNWQRQPFQVVDGSGEVRLRRFSDEEIVLQAGAGATGKLRLNVSYFSRWRAYRDGERLPLTLTYLNEAKHQTGFMTVPLAPGTYRFAFERTLGDRLALPLGMLGVLLCFVLYLADRGARWLTWLRAGFGAICAALDRLSEPRFARLRLWAASVVATVMLGSGLALAMWRPPIHIPARQGPAIAQVRYDFLEMLSHARAAIQYPDNFQRCLRQRDVLTCRDAAGNLDDQSYIASSPATIEEYRMLRCIRARPQRDGLLRIAYPDVPLGDALVGYFGIERAGRLMSERRPVELRISLGGKTIYEGATQSDNHTHYFEIPFGQEARQTADVAFSVRADNVHKRYFCFHAQMVDLHE